MRVGAGKSRLRHELLARLQRGGQRFQVWIGQGDPMRAASPFSAIAGALRRAAGVVEAPRPRGALGARMREPGGLIAKRVP